MKQPKVYMGYGYVITDDEYKALTKDVDLTVHTYFHPLEMTKKWFFGDICYEYKADEAKSIESLAKISSMMDLEDYSYRMGAVLGACGQTVEDISTYWANPSYYFIYSVEE